MPPTLPLEIASTAPARTRHSPGAYRPDIDGLRALAILPVILFHARFFCPGGFVGVDVFFVISGYLITRIVERDLAEGRFSVLVFYQRRIRRIFPALFAMFTVSVPLAWYALPATDLRLFGKSLVAAAVFSSNILFSREWGYFESGASLRPFLHTWTLSVEEQFYLGWPLLLALFSLPILSRWKTRAAVLVLLGSLALSTFWVSQKSDAAFYQLPSRAWELALGALLTLSPIQAFFGSLPRRLASLLSIAGLCSILAAVAAFRDTTPFPGFAALLPCGGAALLIATGEGGKAIGGRLLSLRPLVWIGLISYSLYLWHWPMLVFGRLILNHELTRVERLALVGLTLLAAWLSWLLVESPFRSMRVVRAHSKVWVSWGLATSFLFAATGLVLYACKGFPGRAAAPSAALQLVTDEAEAFQASPCLSRAVALSSGCLFGDRSPGAREQVILWGDSHAAHLTTALDEIGRRHGMTVREIAKAGCPPVPGVHFLPADVMRSDCMAFNQAALAAILATENARIVVLAANWETSLTGQILLARGSGRPSYQESQTVLADALRRTVILLAQNGRRVVLVGQVPHADVVDCLNRSLLRHREDEACKAPLKGLEGIDGPANHLLAEAAAGFEATTRIVNPYDILCGRAGCRLTAGDRILYMDGTHLSAAGARLVGRSIEAAIAAAPATE